MSPPPSYLWHDLVLRHDLAAEVRVFYDTSWGDSSTWYFPLFVGEDIWDFADQSDDLDWPTGYLISKIRIKCV